MFEKIIPQFLREWFTLSFPVDCRAQSEAWRDVPAAPEPGPSCQTYCLFLHETITQFEQNYSVGQDCQRNLSVVGNPFYFPVQP